MDKFKQNIINIYGQPGEQWLNKIPTLIASIKKHYHLSHIQVLSNLSYHYVLSAFQNQQAVILKLGLDITDLQREAAALKAFPSTITAKLLLEDDGVLLQSRALPGTSLHSFFPEKEEEAIQITAQIIKTLQDNPLDHRSSYPYVFGHIKDWLSILNQDWAIPVSYLQKARQLRDQLLNTSTEAILLHGDLHHDNILKNGDDWIIIDPKGVMGDPVYEVAAFIRNPLPALFCKGLVDKTLLDIIDYRIIRFADILGYSPRRILDWCFVQAVLAWVWTLEDGGDDTYFQKLTALFAQS